ncbi:branched-chain amino acid ABC transporter permease [Streptacidiphilus sp. N1-12]|uniref:Branched-chain amino acid ABC transporter permease n=2 Tax=Streptacidiphilus alkalitolerans TaxID=3342712 RepID=A0ABV6WAU5_9ACTN
MTTTTPQTPASAPVPASAAGNGLPTRRAVPLHPALALGLTAAGALVTLVSTFLSWTWTSAFPGDLTIDGNPGGLQVLTLVGAVVTLVYVLAAYGVRGTRWLAPAGPNAALVVLAVGTLATTWFTIIAIADELGGIANWNPGAWIAGLGSLLAVVGALGLPQSGEPQAAAKTGSSPLSTAVATVLRSLRNYLGARPDVKPARPLPRWADTLIVIVLLAVALEVFSYGIDTTYGELFVGFLIIAGFTAWGLVRSGVTERLSQIIGRNGITVGIGAFIAAAAFPFTQTSDQYASVGTNILIFGAVALGLNVVVGLTGLLDLGYVAFLGVGAYTAALVSGAATARFHVVFPWWAAALCGAAAAAVAGLVIGAPTLRLRGDYLAIVTLGFGEIFRIAANNMDGVAGPKLTGGPNGIPNIPDIEFFGVNLGNPHDVLGHTIGRFSNYYWLMLLFLAITVIVFTRAAGSRIGRAWVAIREDETAALAMGINGFRFKLLAFTLGASLAGLAGLVWAHVLYSVTPDPYQFSYSVPPNSAFLVAAVVLGGMGTVSGPILGSTLLFLIPYKLEFVGKYQLLFFGIALILLMRFRPEGIIPNKRNKLEFHEAETEDRENLADVEAVQPHPSATTTGLSEAGA